MILGLSLNSRIVGLAVLKSASLLDYQIKYFTEGWTPDKLLRILECIHAYAKKHTVDRIACLIPYQHHQTEQTKSIIESIDSLCQQNQIPLRFYDPDALCHLCHQPRIRKKTLMQSLCLLYPELSMAEKKELQNRKRYYAKLFEAVGVATLLEAELWAKQ